MSSLRQEGVAEPTVTESTAAPAPAIHQPPTYQGASNSNDASLKKTISGGWGERQSGSGVNVAEALQLARSSSRRTDGQANKEANKNKPSAVEEESAADLEKQETHFNLNDFLSHRLQQADAQGVKNNKALGLAWKDLQVKVAGGGGGYTFVKTLPIAITNTIWKDPWSILTTIIPPLGRLGANSKGESRNLLHPRECRRET